MNLLFRILLTFNATSWMVVVYGIKESWSLAHLPAWCCAILLLCVPLLLSSISIKIASHLGIDTLNGCMEFGLADNEFLPIYLGYFFISLSIDNNTTMIFLYVIIFVFTFMSQTQYFNPIFLLFGYHYYHVLTKQGTKVFIITHGKVIRNKEDIIFDGLKRINDTTYIDIRRR